MRHATFKSCMQLSFNSEHCSQYFVQLVAADLSSSVNHIISSMTFLWGQISVLHVVAFLYTKNVITSFLSCLRSIDLSSKYPTAAPSEPWVMKMSHCQGNYYNAYKNSYLSITLLLHRRLCIFVCPVKSLETNCMRLVALCVPDFSWSQTPEDRFS